MINFPALPRWSTICSQLVQMQISHLANLECFPNKFVSVLFCSLCIYLCLGALMVVVLLSLLCSILEFCLCFYIHIPAGHKGWLRMWPSHQYSLRSSVVKLFFPLSLSTFLLGNFLGKKTSIFSAFPLLFYTSSCFNCFLSFLFAIFAGGWTLFFYFYPVYHYFSDSHVLYVFFWYIKQRNKAQLYP